MTHRALILASMGRAPCRIEGWLRSADTLATLRAIESCGALVEDEGEALVVHPRCRGVSEGLSFDCRNSGTTLRLMLGQRALSASTSRFEGDESLATRPNGPLLHALRALGAQWDGGDSCLPGQLSGPIEAGEVVIAGDVSSQFVSSLLLALPQLNSASVVRVTAPIVSKPYIELTLAMARAFGLVFDDQLAGNDWVVTIPGQQTSHCETYRVEGDWSTAAFPLVAAAITGRACRLVGLNAESNQGDRRLVEHLDAFGQSLEWQGSTLVFQPAPLTNPGAIELAATPDLFPALAVLATQTPGETRFFGAGHLKFKESNRIERMVDGFQRAGITAVAQSDGAVVGYGQPRAAQLESGGDHRILMALECLGLVASGSWSVAGRGHEQVSYPSFYRHLEKFR